MTSEQWEEAQKALKNGSKAGFESHRGCVEASVEARIGVWRPKFQMISADSQRRMATGSYGFLWVRAGK